MGDIMPKISDTINDRVLKAMQREGLTIRSVSSLHCVFSTRERQNLILPDFKSGALALPLPEPREA